MASSGCPPCRHTLMTPPCLKLRLPKHWDTEWVLGFLQARAILGMERVDPEARTIQRVTHTEVGPVCLDLAFRASEVQVSWSGKGGETVVTEVLRRLFDLGTDLRAFHRVAQKEPRLARLVKERPGIRLLGFADPFEGLTRAIVGQQISVAGARTILGRLVDRWGNPLERTTGAEMKAFPRPETLAGAELGAVCSVGLTGRRAETLIGCARAVVEGRLDFAAWDALPSSEVDRELQSLRGIGPWTAAYVRMRVARDSDAFPAQDLGVIKAVRALAPGEDVSGLAERWRPWRAYATLHLWNGLASAG